MSGENWYKDIKLTSQCGAKFRMWYKSKAKLGKMQHLLAAHRHVWWYEALQCIALYDTRQTCNMKGDPSPHGTTCDKNKHSFVNI